MFQKSLFHIFYLIFFFFQAKGKSSPVTPSWAHTELLSNAVSFAPNTHIERTLETGEAVLGKGGSWEGNEFMMGRDSSKLPDC